MRPEAFFSTETLLNQTGKEEDTSEALMAPIVIKIGLSLQDTSYRKKELTSAHGFRLLHSTRYTLSFGVLN